MKNSRNLKVLHTKGLYIFFASADPWLPFLFLLCVAGLILVLLLFQVIWSFLWSFFYQRHLSIYIPIVRSLEGCCAPRITDFINSHTPEHGWIIVDSFIKHDRVSIGNEIFDKIVQQFGDWITSLQSFAWQSVKWQMSCRKDRGRNFKEEMDARPLKLDRER
jgi:hypothetical protein